MVHCASEMVHRCLDSNKWINFSLLFQRDAQSLKLEEEEQEWGEIKLFIFLTTLIRSNLLGELTGIDW